MKPGKLATPSIGAPMGMGVDPAFWRGRRVFVTGHTGFKGCWLASWLLELGCVVKGYALAPEGSPNLFSAIDLPDQIEHVEGDVRDRLKLTAELAAFRPEIIFHLAAQALVRRSYRDPIETYSTNVMGTAHLLEAVRDCPTVRVVVNVTTDKCYENREWAWGYREIDPLGGHDPYSSSKACAELVTSAYHRSFLKEAEVAVATARAGNVLGGGDWSVDRLIPDAVRSFAAGKVLEIRNPGATRPWQHVTEPLAGYLMLAQACFAQPAEFSQAWNFGPRDQDIVPVREVIGRLAQLWGRSAKWRDISEANAPHEANLLKLDISKAAARLGWTPLGSLEQCLQWTVNWYKAFYQQSSAADLQALMQQQIHSRESSRLAAA